MFSAAYEGLASMKNAVLRRFQPNRDTVVGLWDRVRRIPGGPRIFSKIVGRIAPYTGTIGAQVHRLESGYAYCRLPDQRRIRNHLHSIHAIALANFIEETTGLAMVSCMPKGMRGIVTRIEIDYLKKARGDLEAECRAPDVVPGQTNSYRVQTDVRDAAGDIVASGIAHWRIGPNS